MPLFVGRWERRDGADRDALGRAALAMCRNARSTEGVRDSRFYWVNADTVAIITDAEAGAWGPGSGARQTADGAKALFAMSDIARSGPLETWVEARAGEETFQLAKD